MVTSDMQEYSQSGLLVPAIDVAFETASPELVDINIHSPDVVAAKLQQLCVDAYTTTEKLLLTPIATLLEAPETIASYLPEQQVLQNLNDMSLLLKETTPSIAGRIENTVQTVQQHRSLLQSFPAEDLSTSDIRAIKSLLPELALTFRSHALELPGTPQGTEHPTGEHDVLAFSIRALRNVTASMQPLLQVIRNSVQTIDTPVMDEVGSSLQKVLANLGFLCNPGVAHSPASAPDLFVASHSYFNASDELNTASLSDTLGLKAAASDLLQSISGFLRGTRSAGTDTNERH